MVNVRGRDREKRERNMMRERLDGSCRKDRVKVVNDVRFDVIDIKDPFTHVVLYSRNFVDPTAHDDRGVKKGGVVIS